MIAKSRKEVMSEEEDKDFSNNVLTRLKDMGRMAELDYRRSWKHASKEKQNYLQGRVEAYRDLFEHYDMIAREDARLRGKMSAYNEIVAIIDRWRFSTFDSDNDKGSDGE